MNLQIKHGLYLDLDGLYDTRLACLESIDSRLAKVAIHAGYYKRNVDRFPGIDKKTFRQLYEKRHVGILERSTLTRVTDLVVDWIKRAKIACESTPQRADLHLYLNLYPYQIEEKVAQAMIEPLKQLTQNMCQIHLLYLSPEQLSTAYCRERFSMMIMYDFEDWLEIHTKNQGFQKQSLYEIHLLVPELFLSDPVPSNEEIQQLVKESIHPFRAIEQLAQESGLIGLNMIDIRYYCANYPQGFIDEIEQSPLTELLK